MEIAANGIRFNYRLDGPADAPVVTLSHSLAADMRMWEPQLPMLTRHFRVLGYDCRGHGKTEAPPAPYDIATLSEDVAQLCKALGIARTHFVGLSLGGMVGQRLAADHPELVDRLVVCDTAPRIPAEAAPSYKQRADTAKQNGMAALIDRTLERWFTGPYREKHPEVLKRIGDMIAGCPVEGYSGCCEAIAGHDETPRHAKIAAPTLVIVGEHDPSTPVAFAEAIHKGIAGSRLVTIPDAAHLSNVEQPEAFGKAVVDFLRA